QLVSDLTRSGLDVSHPLLDARDEQRNAKLLVITANRGLCGGYNGNLIRSGLGVWSELQAAVPNCQVEISGKRGIAGFKYRGVTASAEYTQFEDKPRFDEVDEIASGYLREYTLGELDRLDVVYMKFLSASRQQVTVETLLPLGSLGEQPADASAESNQVYEFVPSPESILEEVVPTSFKVKLFKCFLDAAVSEQIARMVAMKGATENASDLIKQLSMQYNRARQGRITSELVDLIGGVEALS
ncbi:MAG: ATP synthase F1 subunit gamma, partial [Planctomycetota bacterium]